MAYLLGFINIEECTNNIKGLNTQFYKVKTYILNQSLVIVNHLEVKFNRL